MSKILVVDCGAVPGEADALAQKLGGVAVPNNLSVMTMDGETLRDKAMRHAISYVAAKNGSHPQASIVQLADEIYQFLKQE